MGGISIHRLPHACGNGDSPPGMQKACFLHFWLLDSGIQELQQQASRIQLLLLTGSSRNNQSHYSYDYHGTQWLPMGSADS